MDDKAAIGVHYARGDELFSRVAGRHRGYGGTGWVYIGWACAKYNLQGFLHWGLNFHTAKPFEELVQPHIEGQFLPAGDSHILYPVHEGPLSSHRFEAHRIGMEDYELLAQLKSHDAPRAQQIIARVLQGFDKYSKDVATYRMTRKLLLDAVDTYTQE